MRDDYAHQPVKVAYSIVFWAFFATSCVAMFCLGLVIFLVTLPFDPNGRVQHLYSCFWAQLYFYVNPLWSTRFEGREHLPWHSAAVLVSNHESLGDILVLFGLYRPFKWVSKASVFNAPFLGWNMRLNRYVPLKRGDKESIGKMVAQCESWLRKGVPIMMFPEGTRSSDGEVKPFKDGAFRMAISQKVPIIPIVLTGTSQTLPKHGLVISERSRCRVKVLPPVDPAQFGESVDACRDFVRQLIIAERAKMLAGQS